ncbi:hypothetical protein [Bifidobacterium breve]|uniref:hypothetical protein n=1 Tax=Bifidobacterium breve TaxID=1685 RepID=UPI0029C12767|nr:hypothetical protein [Bifidobacterium breve]MDX5142614.1 hypothetical protein [Bifidobacterium breve]
MEIHRLHRFGPHGPNVIRLHRPGNRRQSRLLHPRNGGSHRGIRHRRIVLRNCEIGTTRELKIRDIARLPIEQIIRSYHPPLWSYEITDSGTNIFGPLPDWEHGVLSSVDFPALREQGPTPDTLKWASQVYSVAQLNKGPATKRLTEIFGIPLRTASHWLTLMKERVPESVSMKLPSPITILDCQNV